MKHFLARPLVFWPHLKTFSSCPTPTLCLHLHLPLWIEWKTLTFRWDCDPILMLVHYLVWLYDSGINNFTCKYGVIVQSYRAFQKPLFTKKKKNWGPTLFRSPPLSWLYCDFYPNLLLNRLVSQCSLTALVQAHFLALHWLSTLVPVVSPSHCFNLLVCLLVAQSQTFSPQVWVPLCFLSGSQPLKWQWWRLKPAPSISTLKYRNPQDTCLNSFFYT